MRTLNRKIQIIVSAALLCSATHTWGYNNPIEGSTTETVTTLWNLGTNILQIGPVTDGNTMIVTNGGIVVSGGGIIGGFNSPEANSSNRVTVTSAGSIWINFGDVKLGGNNGELLITDGGRVDSVSGVIGTWGRENNRVIVSGTGSI